MPEILLHYIWKKELFQEYPQYTSDGRALEILSIGKHNLDSGPDFSDVRIRIHESERMESPYCELIGNVEMHIQSSDWYRHHHETDKMYDNIVLHVVCTIDKDVCNSQGEQVVQCALQFPRECDYVGQMIAEANKMDSAASTIDCWKRLLKDPQLLSEDWKMVLIGKRMECKMQSIKQLLEITKGNWQQAFYISLAHNFGFHTNSIPFEQLAIQTPLSCLNKHRDSLFQLTAILLGQSGLLSNGRELDEEETMLLREYEFLRKKFSLTPLDGHLWKYARMRPQGFPDIRIRQFARLLHQSEFLFSQLMECNDVVVMREILRLRPSSDNKTATIPNIGIDSIHVLLLNTVIPYKYVYARMNGLNVDDVLRLLDKIPAENNRIIRQWKSLGQSVVSSIDSQALIHLYQNYCISHQCLNCEVGYQIFLTNTYEQ